MRTWPRHQPLPHPPPTSSASSPPVPSAPPSSGTTTHSIRARTCRFCLIGELEVSTEPAPELWPAGWASNRGLDAVQGREPSYLLMVTGRSWLPNSQRPVARSTLAPSAGEHTVRIRSVPPWQKLHRVAPTNQVRAGDAGRRVPVCWARSMTRARRWSVRRRSSGVTPRARRASGCSTHRSASAPAARLAVSVGEPPADEAPPAHRCVPRWPPASARRSPNRRSGTHQLAARRFFCTNATLGVGRAHDARPDGRPGRGVASMARTAPRRDGAAPGRQL